MNAVRVVIPVVVAGLVVAYVSNPTVPPASSYHGKTIEDYVQCKVKGIEWFNTKQQWLTWTSWPCGDLEKDYRGGKIRYQPADAAQVAFPEATRRYYGHKPHTFIYQTIMYNQSGKFVDLDTYTGELNEREGMQRFLATHPGLPKCRSRPNSRGCRR